MGPKDVIWLVDVWVWFEEDGHSIQVSWTCRKENEQITKRFFFGELYIDMYPRAGKTASTSYSQALERKGGLY